jgi:hypothetical protein
MDTVVQCTACDDYTQYIQYFLLTKNALKGTLIQKHYTRMSIMKQSDTVVTAIVSRLLRSEIFVYISITSSIVLRDTENTTFFLHSHATITLYKIGMKGIL